MMWTGIMTSITIYTSIYLGAAEEASFWFTPAMILSCAILGNILGSYYGQKELDKRRREILS